MMPMSHIINVSASDIGPGQNQLMDAVGMTSERGQHQRSAQILVLGIHEAA